MNMHAVLLAPALLAGLACSGGNPAPGVNCTGIVVPGIVVTVTRADTSQPIGGARLVLTEGSYSETMSENPYDAGEYRGANERAGHYTLTVSANGFTGKRIDDIEVVQQVCHVKQVRIDVALEPVLSSQLIVIDSNDRERLEADPSSPDPIGR